MSDRRGPNRPRPLIAEIEGRDQDDRASLRAAWRRIQAARAEAGERIGSTDLHVRELLFHVFARHRGEFGGASLGVQLTYTEIAAELETTPATARSIVARAVDEFGLLLVHEQRYVTGGQSANRYAIDWAAVRSTAAATQATPATAPTPATPAGSSTHAELHPGPAPSSATPARPTTARPPATTSHPPALSSHPPALSSHPYKDSPRITPQNQTQHSPPPAAGWPVVASVLITLGMSSAGASSAITAAQRRDLTPADALDLVEAFRRLLAREPKATPGWLHRWFTGQSSPPPPTPDPATAAAPRRTTTTSPTTQREQLRARIVKAGRAALAPEAVIERRLQEALAAFDAAANATATPDR